MAPLCALQRALLILAVQASTAVGAVSAEPAPAGTGLVTGSTGSDDVVRLYSELGGAPYSVKVRCCAVVYGAVSALLSALLSPWCVGRTPNGVVEHCLAVLLSSSVHLRSKPKTACVCATHTTRN